MANDVLLPKILNEGYCCLYGYVKLCQARNQTVKDMAEFLNVSPHLIWRQIRLIKQGTQKCQGISQCDKALIEEISLMK